MDEAVVVAEGFKYEPEKWEYVIEQMTSLGNKVFRYSEGMDAQPFFDTATAIDQ